ncbi:MAG TPA: hypothetical protein VHA37_02225 [Candidatus Saccharimonadales bacterium]|nr:hypothetical protein [Candidatus Saccharimonadales bacterium]
MAPPPSAEQEQEQEASPPSPASTNSETSETSETNEPTSGVDQLREEVKKADNILLKAQAVFPFDLFPDTITIDRQKLTLVRRRFLIDRQTLSVQLSDIKNVQATLGPLFGSITVISQNFANSTQTIRYLSRRDVIAIQRILQGFIVAHNEGVDMSDIDDDTLKQLLDRLGRGEPEERPVVQ